MTRYASGRRLEWKVRDLLEAQGYTVIRSAGSKGLWDLVAFNKAEWQVVQVKRQASKRDYMTLKQAVVPPQTRKWLFTTGQFFEIL